MTIVRTNGGWERHDHDRRYARIGSTTGGGGGPADVTITGTEGVTVAESPSNTFALGLTASPDDSNTIEIRANGIYSASGAIPPEYVTEAELEEALAPYATYTHTQSSPASTWTITHNLNRFPAVDVVDSGGSVVLPDVRYDSANVATVTFGSATSGKAYCN